MRQRITFIQHPDAPFTFNQAILSPDSLSIHDIDGAREERVTFRVDELPEELRQVLGQSHRIHLRWATQRQYHALAPFSSRVSAGLHVFFSPVRVGEGEVTKRGESGLCTLLKKAFDPRLKCENAEKSFILSTRSAASTAAYQFYESLPSLDTLVTYLQQEICARDDLACSRHAALLLSADSVDLNYDSISHALTMSGLWSRAPEGAPGWTETIRKHAAGTDKVEVGLLGAEQATDPEEIKMGGLLAVVGEDTELKPTLFSFPSRHHPLPADATYSVSFAPPTGLHPTMTISMPRAAIKKPPGPPDATCALHTYLTLPSSIFGDKYQLSTTDPLFLESHNLVALRSVAGQTDLEAPDWSISQWGSNWLLELATPSPSDQSSEAWNVTVPLHLRYLPPSESGYRSTSVPWPVVFWACTAEDGTKMAMNPFDRVNLGWESLFGPRTMFYQLHPSQHRQHHRLVEEVEVPVLRLGHAGFFQSQVIETGTVIVIVLGFLWVLWKLGRVAWSTGITPARGRRSDKQGKDE
ncbi:hypothetical protein P175DRAFT_0429428 [Aspergillus ochraceoroseus IBT 24754]|uniref:Protein PBN1 n=1 Tax=Aspergillus ochraceoroseus IBT 24754 TaxID=1392256 RepID=A0A2T5M8C5_9EURO|nr:uncharacterized protein P175DRAFT_0429428 [Aspergillus ochraceoroseus IBT 24754]PTU24788.1 hypothetical protein P175DRAFT_0429428 [Aspergillus ochraceoroseus IBT 24754]